MHIARNKVIVVAGQSGCGKDYLVERANQPPDQISHVGWGALFGALVGEDRDHITYSPDDPNTLKVQKIVTQQVLALQPVIVTSHPVKISNDTEYVNWDIEKDLNASTHIYVTSPPELIAERLFERNRTTTRATSIPSIDVIAKQQERKIELVKNLSDYVGSNLIFIDNVFENFHQNIATIRAAIADIRG